VAGHEDGILKHDGLTASRGTPTLMQFKHQDAGGGGGKTLEMKRYKGH
jgi:hypothetical protein